MTGRKRAASAGSTTKAMDPAEPGIFAALRRLTGHLSPRRRRQSLPLLLFMLVGAFAEMVTIGAVLPFLTLLSAPERITRYPLTNAIAGRFAATPATLMIAALVGFVLAAIIAAVVRLALLKSTQRFIFEVGHELSVAVYDSLLHRNYLYHMQNNSAEALATLQKVNAITSYFFQPALQGLISATVGVFIVSALVWADPPLALTALASFGFLYVLSAVPARVALRRNSRIAARVQGERIQIVQEGIGAIRDVLLDRAQPIYLKRFAALDDAYRNAQAMTTFLGMAPRFLIEGIGMVLIALVAYSFAQRDGGLLAVLPMLGALAIGAQRLMPLLQQVYVAWVQMTANLQNLTNVLDFLDQPVVKAPTPLAALPFERSIDVDRLSFAYTPDGPSVLNDVSLSIPFGATIGFIGRTGSGKSTFLDLLMGLLDARTGAITVDGRPLDELARWSWHMNISHVPQVIYLTDGTIAENIAFGLNRADIDMAHVRHVARLAGIADHIESLPEHYDSFVGERGQRLSGGQRQRIGIARALYAERAVLVLDEATSALDTGTEQAIMDAIGALAGKRTVIIVAHRLSTLRGCSHIFRFDDGRLVQAGSFAEVVGTDGGPA